MSKLVVKRDSGYADRVRKYKVICNSKAIGAVGNGETVSLEVPAGRHEVHFKIDWARSNKVVVNLGQEETATVSVRSTLRGWKLFFAIFYVLFMPHKYLRAESQ